MRQNLLFLGFWVMGAVSVTAGPAALAESEPGMEVQHQQPITDIPSLNEIEQPLTTAEGLLVQQPAPTPAQVTGVQLKPTEKGLEVILETAAEFPEVLTSSAENSLITDIPNAQLRLSGGGVFRRDNPTQEIAAVEVTNLDAKTIRVTVTGKAGVPTAEVSQSPQALVLSVVAPPAPAPQPTPAVPEQKPEPQAEEEPLDLTVTAEEEAEGYNVPDATTATRTDTPIRDIPANIQVIPRQVIEDQKAIRIGDAVRNVSGVNFSTSFGNRSSQFNVRGFDAAQFRNGLFETGGSTFFNTRTDSETANVERIEVLKGPASVLFGQAQPGGLINLVTKRPLPDPYYAAEFTVGSFNFYRPTLDISGPLNSGKTLGYRLNLAYENAGSFRDFVESERVFVAPVLSWNISPNTTLTFEGSYLHDQRTFDRGLVAIGDRPADLPISRALFDPERSLAEFDEKRGYIYLDHRFNESLSLRSAFRATTSFESWPNGTSQGDALLPDNRTLPITAYYGDQYYETYTLQNDLVGKFETGPISHTVLFGVELARGTGKYSNGATATGASIDIFNPVYDFSYSPLEPSPDGEVKANTIGVYLQDQITVLDNLKLVIGGRFDSFDSEETYPDEPSFNSTAEAKAFSPRVGIVYQPIEPVSLYANYSQAFLPQFGRSADREPFEPERGTQYEVGVKADFLDGRLSSTVAAYQITKSNVLTADPDNPDFSIQVGEQRSRGVELDVVGVILPGWNVIASYAYTDAVITEDNTYEVGNRLNNVPRNTASLWTTYEIQNGSLAGLGFGAGVFFVDSRQGDLENSFVLPSYARTDAAVYYTRGNLRAALNIKNLFDVRYYEGAQYRESVFPGAPFTVLGTISVEF